MQQEPGAASIRSRTLSEDTLAKVSQVRELLNSELDAPQAALPTLPAQNGTLPKELPQLQEEAEILPLQLTQTTTPEQQQSHPKTSPKSTSQIRTSRQRTRGELQTITHSVSAASLCAATLKGDREQVEKLLLSISVDVNGRDPTHKATALWLAAKLGNIEMVSILLEGEADPSISDLARHLTPLDIALCEGQLECAVILEHFIAERDRREEQFQVRRNRNQYEESPNRELKNDDPRVLKYECVYNERGHRIGAAVHEDQKPVFDRYRNVVEAKMRERKHFNWRANDFLSVARSGATWKLSQLVKQYQADGSLQQFLNHRDEHGRNSLMIAACSRKAEVVEILVKAGSKPEEKNLFSPEGKCATDYFIDPTI